MGALTFVQADGVITVTHDGADRTFTVERLREIVTTYLTYYREGRTDLEMTLDYRLDAAIYGQDCPAEFDSDCQEYWSHRKELYAYVQEAGLFPLTLTEHTAAEVDKAEFGQKVKSRLGTEACNATFTLWKSLDAQIETCDFSDATQCAALLSVLRSACQSSPVCAAAVAIALEDYGITRLSESCKCCFNYRVACYTPDGAHYLTHQLTAKLASGDGTLSELEALRTQILAAVPARDAVLVSVLGGA